MYATIADMRAEGVTAEAASDERLFIALADASAQIDRVTGWFFSPRTASFSLDGRGTSSIELPVPPLRVDRLRIGAEEMLLPSEDLVVVGSPVGPGFDAPRLTLRKGRFPKGSGTVVVTGRWGYTEPDGTPEGRTPLSIRRACMMLALRTLAPLANDNAFVARSRWRIVEERTRDQSYRMEPALVDRSLTGDPDIDALLLHYRRLRAMGAV